MAVLPLRILALRVLCRLGAGSQLRISSDPRLKDVVLKLIWFLIINNQRRTLVSERIKSPEHLARDLTRTVTLRVNYSTLDGSDIQTKTS
ncbi:hypothetical protein RND71_028424 [Anisodus tanguticus]|uniref:Secreted protein n=1 Tax=Anisodus tanguticus TaxID=243964 RepID=A0AAE1RJR1_9SOLA|nr:hypothetical protein RND71_028424 [Anisodus tanguticus]